MRAPPVEPPHDVCDVTGAHHIVGIEHRARLRVATVMATRSPVRWQCHAKDSLGLFSLRMFVTWRAVRKATKLVRPVLSDRSKGPRQKIYPLARRTSTPGFSTVTLPTSDVTSFHLLALFNPAGSVVVLPVLGIRT